MSNDIKNTDKRDFWPIVRAIGSDLEQTQVRVIASANADMLFHYWKVGHFVLYLQKRKRVGEAKSLTIYPRQCAHNILIRRDIPLVTLLYVPVCQCLSVGNTEQNG